MLKKLILVFIFSWDLLFLRHATAQGQFNIPEYITQRFENYCKSVPREELFIHTDKEEYISGEDLWFNIYLFDRQSLKPTLNSKIVYFEILNPANKPVLQKRILLINAFGPGQIILPDTLSSGTYTIRAYTNWMKNFLPYNCFLKDFKIYNPYRSRFFKRSEMPGKLDSVSNENLPKRSDFSVKVNNLKHDSLEIFIHSDSIFRSDNKNTIYLFIQSHGIINHLSTETITEENTKIVIPKKSLTSGISQITLFDLKGPVIDRFIYIPSIQMPVVTIHSDDSCEQRGKVTLEIELTNKNSVKSDLSNISVSVALVSNSKIILNLNDYLIMGTEFGLSTFCSKRGIKISDLPVEILDSLLLSLKSNWINWELIFSNEKQVFKYPHENEVHYLTGSLLTNNLQPASINQTLILSKPGNEAVFQYSKTDKNGIFNFGIDIDDKVNDIILQPESKLKNLKIYLEPLFANQSPSVGLYTNSTEESFSKGITRQKINYQIERIYGSSSIGPYFPSAISPIKPKNFYGQPDFVLNMKDFVKLDSLQEVFFELVPHVTLQYVNTQYIMSILDPSGNKLDGNPTVMIDGIIIRDLSVIARIDPNLIEKIEVVWNKYRVGGYLFNGIVNLISKTGDLYSEILPSDAVKVHSNGIEHVYSFVSPDYSSAQQKESPVADYRNTLYWNPLVKTDKVGKAILQFWSADLNSDYVINIQGITSSGEFISISKTLKVK